jgi:hypothetical protein
MKLIKWLLWVLKGKPMIHHTGYNCGCCGKWYDEEFDVPEHKDDWFSYWGLCPEGKGCQKIKWNINYYHD